MAARHRSGSRCIGWRRANKIDFGEIEDKSKEKTVYYFHEGKAPEWESKDKVHSKRFNDHRETYYDKPYFKPDAIDL